MKNRTPKQLDKLGWTVLIPPEKLGFNAMKIITDGERQALIQFHGYNKPSLLRSCNLLQDIFEESKILKQVVIK